MTPTTRETADHAELARLAEAATPGPWYRGHNENGCAQGEMSVWPDAKMIGAIIAQCGHQAPWAGRFEQPAKDAAFIAAANPATVLALLSEIAELRGERDEAVELLKQFRTRIMLERRCNSLGVNVAEPIMEKTRAFLANQGADQ